MRPSPLKFRGAGPIMRQTRSGF
ncbi:protein of unknown function [Azospirillum baldaniorum]|uniref:Uncharacterized protein n=1 Tax=Azospirillum baldaniorum TaxID=1064539 RepID=A0A9P1NLI3_9PROT|nr:protein of unknown function [Azospirillum baldaniorum]